MQYSLFYSGLWVSKNLCFSIFFLLTQYEVCSKFQYYNIWGYRPRRGWGLSECFLLAFKGVELQWKGVQILLFDLIIAIFTLNLGVVFLTIWSEIAHL